MTTLIKHLVLPGGCVNGIQTLGILSHLSDEKFFNVNDIESIDATSVGSFLAVLIAMKFEWSYIIDYIIKRPWHATIEFSINTVISIFTDKGFYNRQLYEMFFKPFFDSRNISLNISMKEFFDLTNVELHFYSVNLNAFEIVNLSHLTHPDLSLLTAVQMTSALPVLVAPVFYNDNYYIDGAFGVNYPLYMCLRRDGIIPDEVLAVYNEIKGGVNQETNADGIQSKEKSSFDFFLFFCNQLIRNTKLKTEDKRCYIKHEVVCYVNSFNVDSLKQVMTDMEFRQSLFTKGVETAKQFIYYFCEKNNNT
jgi:predicted acylesterase/phospholipase RssA